MTSPRSTALLADAMASSLDPRLLMGAKTPPPRQQQHLPSSTSSSSSRNSQQQELIIPLDSPSNIPHPASASSSSIAMRNPLDTWHTPVRDPHPVRRPSSSAGQQRPFFLHQSPHITSPPSTSATTTTRSPQNISTSTMSPTTLNPNLPPSSSATPAFFLECFGKDVTPGKRPAILIAQQDTSRDDDDSTSTAGQTTQLIIASPAEEHAPRMWPSISADSARTASPEPFGLSSQLDCALSLTKDRNADNDREEEDDEQLEIKKSPYDSPPPRLGGLFDGLPTLSPSSSVRLPPEFRFGQQQQSPPLASSTRRVNWLRTNSDDGPVSSDGRARSEADVSHTRPPFPSTPDTEDEYANGDEDDDDDDRASIASSLLSLPVSVVTTASGGNNSRFLEEQREREQNRERENERERERSRFLSLTGAGNNTSLPTGRRGLGLSLSSAGKGAGGSAKETASNFLSALSSKRNPNSNAGSPSRSPARTPGTGSISFVTPPPGSIWNDIAEGSSGGGGGGAASGTKGNGRRSRTASLLSAAGGFPLHLPLGVGSTKENGGSGSNSAGPPTPSGTSGPGAVVASWKRRGLAALTSPNMSSSSAALAERRGSMNAVMLNAGTTSPPLLPSPGPTFSPMARSSSGAGAGAGAAPMNPYFFPSAPPTSNSHQISTSAPQSEANTPPPHPHPPIPHRPASILLKPSLGGAIGVNSTATSRPQSTTSTQSANSSCASGSGSGSGSSGVGGRRASDGALAGMVMSSSNQPPQPSSLRMSVHDAVVGRGKVVAGGGGGMVPSPTSSSSGTPAVVGGGGTSSLGGPIFTREVRIGGWTYIGHKASGWVEYDIRVQTLKGTTIRASRRFSSFVALRKTLAKQLPHHRPSLPELPPRRHGLLHRYSPTHLEQRRLALQRWLHKILRDPRWGGLECAREFVLGGLGGVGVGVGLGMGMGVGMGVGAGMQIAGSSLGVGGMLDGERVGGSSLTVASGTGTGTGTPFGLAGARA
ncbi:hypothetical protein CF327_g6357 [Tilletia walkeri]|uniref:Endosomal/vacuolar adapter protein YPT35 n=1 Tax=Tilletia walkeri TaxID=117179 RepID=A0A8X7T3M2_9BASI|nr:hypothetical protein CF327_g6357 [Tilletia walkeri]KAE8266908.1 hypothetical protein A4X09_0g5442 [Tilletia walkeri]